MQQVTFRPADRGGVMTRWDGKIAFPQRGTSPMPQAGETWECGKAGENASGSVVFLNCFQMVKAEERMFLSFRQGEKFGMLADYMGDLFQADRNGPQPQVGEIWECYKTGALAKGYIGIVVLLKKYTPEENKARIASILAARAAKEEQNRISSLAASNAAVKAYNEIADPQMQPWYDWLHEIRDRLDAIPEIDMNGWWQCPRCQAFAGENHVPSYLEEGYVCPFCQWKNEYHWAEYVSEHLSDDERGMRISRTKVYCPKEDAKGMAKYIFWDRRMIPDSDLHLFGEEQSSGYGHPEHIIEKISRKDIVIPLPPPMPDHLVIPADIAKWAGHIVWALRDIVLGQDRELAYRISGYAWNGDAEHPSIVARS